MPIFPRVTQKLRKNRQTSSVYSQYRCKRDLSVQAVYPSPLLALSYILDKKYSRRYRRSRYTRNWRADTVKRRNRKRLEPKHADRIPIRVEDVIEMISFLGAEGRNGISQDRIPQRRQPRTFRYNFQAQFAECKVAVVNAGLESYT